MKTFHLTVTTPDRNVFDGEAESLLVRSVTGDIEIMAGHADLIAPVATGRAVLRTNGNARVAAVSGGVLTVSGGRVTMLNVTFEFADEIDRARAEAAKARAEEKLRTEKDEKELARARAKLMRAVSRLGVSEPLR